MTVVDVEGTEQRRLAASYRRPGLTERMLVTTTMFLVLYNFPSEWFISRLDPGGAPLTTVATLALTLLAFARVVGNFDGLIAVLRLEGRWSLFVALNVASIIWTTSIALTSRQVALDLAVFLWAIYLVLRFDVGTILRLLALAGIPGAIVNYAFVFALPQYGVDPTGTWTGVLPQKNALGYTATMLVPLLLIVAGIDRPRRLLYYTFAVANFGLLLGSESKTMLVATVLPIALLAVFQGFRSRKTLRGAVLTSFFGSTVFMVLFATANLGFIADLLGKDITLTGRTELWGLLIPLLFERPFTGFGVFAPFAGYFSPTHEIWIRTRWEPPHAHNALLQIWLEVGVFGVLLFLGTFVRAVGRAIEVVRRVPGRIGLWPLSFLTTTLLISISESGVTASAPSYALFAICVWTCALNRDRPIEGTAAPIAERTPTADEIEAMVHG